MTSEKTVEIRSIINDTYNNDSDNNTLHNNGHAIVIIIILK